MALQLRQVVEQRRREAASLAETDSTSRRPACVALDDGPASSPSAGSRRASCVGLSPAEPGAAVVVPARPPRGAKLRDDLVVVLGNEGADRQLALDEHRERRRLDPADRESVAVARRCRGPREVHADEPVGAARPWAASARASSRGRGASSAKPSRIASGVSDEIQSRLTGRAQPAAS